ncbi:MAG: DNA polymerase III subunit delta [Solirubrobacterales bacterium]|nr:DNA polymerase III subunit delta [Solirubrobacterales bacterium]HRV59417.1 DNA polymerase III subunit delta [Solirubrobacterales bacterium]
MSGRVDQPPRRRGIGENVGVKPAYLIHGSDSAKIDQARARLRQRAEAESGAGGLEVFEPADGKGSPDADALAASIGSLSLMPGRRYLLADRIEKWGKNQTATVAEAIREAPDETTVVLIARGKVPAGIAEAVKKVGGETLAYEAPEGARLPVYLVESAAARDFELTPEAARYMIARMGESLPRLGAELDRLALWAGAGGSVDVEDLQEMVADTSETSNFALGDAVISGDRKEVIAVAERLLAQGATAGSTVYTTSTSVRRAHKALVRLEAGEDPARLERELGVPPFVARRLINSLSGTTVEAMREAAIALAELEVWTRGGAEYPDELALDLALLAATE